MIVRTRESPSEVWSRFLVPREGFEVLAESPRFEARVVASASGILELCRDLVGHLAPLVSVAVEDWRSGQRWRGGAVSREDVRRELVMGAAELARTGGAEFAIFDDEDQISISGNLDLWVFGRTARWYHLLRGRGLRRFDRLEPRSWCLRREEFPPAAHATANLVAFAKRLGLPPDRT